MRWRVLAVEATSTATLASGTLIPSSSAAAGHQHVDLASPEHAQIVLSDRWAETAVVSGNSVIPVGQGAGEDVGGVDLFVEHDQSRPLVLVDETNRGRQPGGGPGADAGTLPEQAMEAILDVLPLLVPSVRGADLACELVVPPLLFLGQADLNVGKAERRDHAVRPGSVVVVPVDDWSECRFHHLREQVVEVALRCGGQTERGDVWPKKRFGVDRAGDPMALVNDQHDWPCRSDRRRLGSAGIDHHEVDASRLWWTSPAAKEGKVLLGDTKIVGEPDRPLILQSDGWNEDHESDVRCTFG